MFDNLDYTAKQIDPRESWDSDHVAWIIIINGEAFNYQEGIGHFMKHGANKLAHKTIRQAIMHPGKSVRDHNGRNDFKWAIDTGVNRDRVKKKGVNDIEITQPDIKDVLYCLVSDGDAIDYTFEEWADCYGYDTDSIKAKDTYDHCVRTYQQLRRVGLDIDAAREFFQDY